MVIRQSEKFDPYINIPSARSFPAICLAPLQAASTFGKSSSCSGRVVVLSENSTRYFAMLNILLRWAVARHRAKRKGPPAFTPAAFSNARSGHAQNHQHDDQADGKAE